MKKPNNGLRGVGKVFSFTLTQLLKAKSNIASLVILLVFALAMPPITGMANGGFQGDDPQGGEEEPVYGPGTVEEIWLKDESGMAVSEEEFAGTFRENSYFAETVFRLGVLPEEKRDPDHLQLILRYIAEDNLLHFELVGAEGTDFSEDVFYEVEACCSWYAERLCSGLADLTEEQKAILDKAVNMRPMTMEEFLEEVGGPETDDPETDEGEFGIQFAYSVIVMFVCVLSSSYIIRSVAEEKASKLVEQMIVSVDPMALIAGKTLAVLCYTALQLALVAGAYTLSSKITALFMNTGSGTELMNFSVSLEGLTLTDGAAALLSTLLGILAISLMSGLVGAGCSTIEDTGNAQTVPMLIVMLSYMVSVVSEFMPVSVIRVLTLIPMLSVFIGPVQYFLGGIGIGWLCLSWLLQAGLILLLARLCRKVYRDLLFYKGTRLSFSRILRMAFPGKGAI